MLLPSIQQKVGVVADDAQHGPPPALIASVLSIGSHHQLALRQSPNGMLPLTVDCSLQHPERAGATGLLKEQKGLHGPTATAQPPLQQNNLPSGCAPPQPFGKNSLLLLAAGRTASLELHRSSTVHGSCCPCSLHCPQNWVDSMSSCSPPENTGNYAAHRLP